MLDAFQSGSLQLCSIVPYRQSIPSAPSYPFSFAFLLQFMRRTFKPEIVAFRGAQISIILTAVQHPACSSLARVANMLQLPVLTIHLRHAGRELPKQKSSFKQPRGVRKVSAAVAA